MKPEVFLFALLFVGGIAIYSFHANKCDVCAVTYEGFQDGPTTKIETKAVAPVPKSSVTAEEPIPPASLPNLQDILHEKNPSILAPPEKKEEKKAETCKTASCESSKIDLSKYVLKSEVANYAPKTTLQACPPVPDMSKYIRKTQLPACSTPSTKTVAPGFVNTVSLASAELHPSMRSCSNR